VILHQMNSRAPTTIPSDEQTYAWDDYQHNYPRIENLFFGQDGM
jgi:hypothetical protein